MPRSLWVAFLYTQYCSTPRDDILYGPNTQSGTIWAFFKTLGINWGLSEDSNCRDRPALSAKFLETPCILLTRVDWLDIRILIEPLLLHQTSLLYLKVQYLARPMYCNLFFCYFIFEVRLMVIRIRRAEQFYRASKQQYLFPTECSRFLKKETEPKEPSAKTCLTKSLQFSKRASETIKTIDTAPRRSEITLTLGTRHITSGRK